MKAPFVAVERISARLFERQFDDLDLSAPLPREKALAVASICFDLAEIWGEESERRWSQRDTERAEAALEKANRR